MEQRTILFEIEKKIEFVVGKFTKDISNIFPWMNIFEGECTRLGIEDDGEKSEGRRLFLVKTSVEY